MPALGYANPMEAILSVIAENILSSDSSFPVYILHSLFVAVPPWVSKETSGYSQLRGRTHQHFCTV
jgi:hypothetical protein